MCFPESWGRTTKVHVEGVVGLRIFVVTTHIQNCCQKISGLSAATYPVRKTSDVMCARICGMSETQNQILSALVSTNKPKNKAKSKKRIEPPLQSQLAQIKLDPIRSFERAPRASFQYS